MSSILLILMTAIVNGITSYMVMIGIVYAIVVITNLLLISILIKIT